MTYNSIKVITQSMGGIQESDEMQDAGISIF